MAERRRPAATRSTISSTALPRSRTRWPSARRAAPRCRRGWKRWWNRCSDKIEQMQNSRGDDDAFGHLEDRIVQLVEKLDASDSRLGHLEAIERGLADLLVHIEDMRANKDAGGLRAQGSPGVDDLKHDIARTQDALEAVHGTLGHVVDRLATDRKGHSRRGAPHAAADSDAPLVSRSASSRSARSTMRPAAQRRPMPTPPHGRSRRHRRRPRPGACRRPPSMPIDPDLPADQPLEPGSGPPPLRPIRPRASPPRKPPSAAPRPGRRAGGKSSFIAAARRAAQAAVQEPSARAPRAGAGRGATSPRPHRCAPR